MRPYIGKRSLDVVASDPVIQLYLTRRIEKYGRIPITVGTRIRTAAYKFLKLNGIEPSNHALSDLVSRRLSAPKDDGSLSQTTPRAAKGSLAATICSLNLPATSYSHLGCCLLF